MAARKSPSKQRKTKRKARPPVRVPGYDLTKVLKGYKHGEWVALNMKRTRVLLWSKDPADLVRRVEAKGLHDKVVLHFVRDPKMTYVY